MRLPSKETCSKDPVLNMLRNNDSRGFMCSNRGKNKAFLNRRRVNTALSLLKKHLSDNKNVKIADFACGNANFSLQLFEDGYRVDLIDNEKAHFDYIKLKVDVDDRLNFYHSDLNEFTSSDKYDAIFLGEAIEHMENPETTLTKLRSHLKTGGLLCLTTPNGDFVDCKEPSWDEVKDQKERNQSLANNIGNHVCEFPQEELAKLVKKAGFGLLEHKLVNSQNISKKSLLRRVLPESMLWSLDDIWSKKKDAKGRTFGRIQIIVAQRFH